MKSLVLLMGLFLLSSGLGYAQSAESDNHLIYWTQEYRLTYTDFDALPKRYSDNAAFSVLGFKSSFEMTYTQYTADIKAYFDKDSSWARSWVPILLAHEQGHFDIAELHARKFREQLKTAMLKDDLSVSKFEYMNSEIMKDLEAAQLEYDKATNYSMDYRAQLEWLDLIKERLDKMSAFANTKIVVKRK